MPASIGVARCTGVLDERCAEETELFVPINAPEIVALEVGYERARHRYTIAAPGYIVRRESLSEVPTAYRWLGADGDVV